MRMPGQLGQIQFQVARQRGGNLEAAISERRKCADGSAKLKQ